MIKNAILFVVALAGLGMGARAVKALESDVRAHGAIGDGRAVNTRAIQEAIDAVHKAGGGTVVLAEGVYLSGTVLLRSNVTLNISRGTTLLASTRAEDYRSVASLEASAGGEPARLWGLVLAEDQERIGLAGGGLLDGNGLAFGKSHGIRPRVICFVRCRNVAIEGITTRSGRSWTQHYVQCSDLTIRGVTVQAHLPEQNNDGIDLDECHRVQLTESTVIADDDAIVLKSRLTHDHGTRDVLIENCRVYGKKSAVKIGTETLGPFENIIVRNLVAYGTRGINLYSVDGAHVRNVLVENVSIRDGYAAILMRLGDRAQAVPAGQKAPLPPGSMSNIVVRNLDATLAAKSFHNVLLENGVTLFGPADEKVIPVAEQFICGLPGHLVQNVRLENIRVRRMPGGGTERELRRTVPENASAYPIHGMFGKLPAYGLYIRHARNIALSNVLFELAEPDGRPALFTEDVEQLACENMGPAARIMQAPDLK